MSTLEAIKYKNGHLEILDQLLLPEQTVYIEVNSCDDGWNAIKTMQVRGAPAIAIVGCLSLAVELYPLSFETVDQLRTFVKAKLDYLVTARPTAVNIQLAAVAVNIVANKDCACAEELKRSVIKVIEFMLEKDILDNKAIGDHGATAILALSRTIDKVNIVTHCNTGSLATAGYGTALGVIRSLHARGKLEHVYCTETRPYNQGARLTAYELVHENIPATLICDDMVAFLMSSQTIAAVVVGADRVANNGDTANKIGTYQLAVIAKHHGVAFYVAAPFTSIDFSLASGKDIPIEERPEVEMTHVRGHRIAAPGIKCWNPAFDVTPAELITGIVTEKGVFTPQELSTMSS